MQSVIQLHVPAPSGRHGALRVDDCRVILGLMHMLRWAVGRTDLQLQSTVWITRFTIAGTDGALRSPVALNQF